MSKEIEFKFAVDEEAAFDALIRKLDLPAREFHTRVTQVNHFFDTGELALHAAGLVLRLREEAGVYFLTLKGKEQRRSDDGVVTERIEEEVRLAPQVAVDVLRGTLSPRDALQQRIQERNPDALRLLDETLANHELHYVGQFENQRTKLQPVPFTIGPQEVALVFELDRTRFGEERVDHEIEVEIATDVDAGLAHETLSELLASAGITWRSAPSKAKRFFELARRDT